jgi:hypothetical protein
MLRRESCLKGARTLNLYLHAAIAFLNWMERMGRIKANPLRFAGEIDEGATGVHG